MRFIRLIFFSILSLFAIASFIGILLPSGVLVSRAVDIAAPKDSIFPYVKDINQWKKWMDGLQQATAKESSANHTEIGGTIIDIISVTDTTVVSTWTTKTSAVQKSTVRMIANPSQHVTIVQWQFEQKLKWYPWERFGSMMNDKILGTMMEKNLNNLKNISEGKQ